MPPDSDHAALKDESSIYEILLRLTLIVALLCAAIAGVTYFDVLKLSDQFDYQYLYVVAIFQISFWIFSSYVWQQVVLRTCEVKLPFTDCFSQNALLLIGKYIPGKVWGIVVRGHRLKKFNIDISGSVHATYMELLASIHTGVIFGLCCWLFAINHQWSWLVIVFGVCSLFLLPILQRGMIKLAISLSPQKWRENISKYADIKISITDYLIVSSLYVIEWLLLGVIAVLIFSAMQGAMPNVNTSILLAGSNAMGMVIGFLALFAPAGIGVRELVNGGILLGSLSLVEITTLLILLRCWNVASDLIVGGLAVILARK